VKQNVAIKQEDDASVGRATASATAQEDTASAYRQAWDTILVPMVPMVPDQSGVANPAQAASLPRIG
jgi:hypothetical protein